MTVKVGFENLPAPIIKHLNNVMNMRPVYPHVYHVTELTMCLRKAYYRRVYGGGQRGVKGLWNMYRGSVLDSAWSPLFDFNQRTFVVTKRGVTITGTCDFVYDDGSGSILYDLKMPASTYYRKREGAGQGYRRQCAAYLALAHASGELVDVHRARVLMVAEEVVVEEVGEWTDMLDSWLLPRAFLLDAALNSKDPSILQGPEEGWECREEFCSASTDFRIKCAYQGRDLELPVRVSMEEFEEAPEPAVMKRMKEMLY